MVLNVLQRFGQGVAASVAPQRAPAAAAPAATPIDVRCLQARWQSVLAQTTTGFMALHAVRRDGRVVDFELHTASVDAIELLHGGRPAPQWQRLAQVLAGHAERLEVFDHYRHVVEFGIARAAHHRVAALASQDVLRHDAVRLSDGVAVRLTNVSALRRLSELQREIESRALIGPSQPSTPSRAGRPLAVASPYSVR